MRLSKLYNCYLCSTWCYMQCMERVNVTDRYHKLVSWGAMKESRKIRKILITQWNKCFIELVYCCHIILDTDKQYLKNISLLILMLYCLCLGTRS